MLVCCWGLLGVFWEGGGGGGEGKERGQNSGRAQADLWGGRGVHIGMSFRGGTAAQEAGGKEVG